MSAVADGVGRVVCALTGAWRAEAAEPPTHSIADGTALHRGRVGSRHFEAPLRISQGRFSCASIQSTLLYTRMSLYSSVRVRRVRA